MKVFFPPFIYFELHFYFWNSLKKDEALNWSRTALPGVIMLETISKSKVFFFFILRLHLKVFIKLPNMPKHKTREIFRKLTSQKLNSMHSKDNSMVKQVSSSYMIASSSHLNFLYPLNIPIHLFWY